MMSEGRIAGVIGLGSMGMGAARSLVAAGIETWGTDVRAESVEDFVANGGKGAANPAELASKVDALLVLVVNAAQTESVLFGETGAVKHMKKGAVVVASSTVPATYARELEGRLAEHGLLMVDAPVSGGAAKAATGEMTVMGSGTPEAFEAADFLLKAIAMKVYQLGDQAGPGSTVKTINQLLAGVHIAAAAEAMALGIRAGVAPADLFEVISNSAGASWMFNNRVPHILDGDYAPLSAVNIFVKDLGIVLETGKELTFPLPLSAAAHQQFLGAAAAGLGKEDDSAVIKVFQKLAGIDLPEAKDG
jgi:L-threonate 2-dehydrogenase